MDEDSIQAVRDLLDREFTTVGDIRRLLGLLSYHRRHIQDFATIAKPLTDLLLCKDTETQETPAEKKKAVPSRQKIVWAQQHQEALKKLVQLITNPPMLAYPDYTKEFFVHTDASGQGLGAILCQSDGEQNKAVAYASRKL